MNAHAVTRSPIALALGLAIAPPAARSARACTRQHGPRTRAGAVAARDAACDHAAMGHARPRVPRRTRRRRRACRPRSARRQWRTASSTMRRCARDATASPRRRSRSTIRCTSPQPRRRRSITPRWATAPRHRRRWITPPWVMPCAPAEPREPIPALTAADRAAAFPDLVAPRDARPARRAFRAVQPARGLGRRCRHGLRLGRAGLVRQRPPQALAAQRGRTRAGAPTPPIGAADLEVLYGRPLARWWDVVAGIRHDFEPGAAQTWAAIGVIGLAPQKFEVEATAYVGASGRTAARVEVEYELLLSNRLILQPLVEAQPVRQGRPASRHRLGTEHGRGRLAPALRVHPPVRALHRRGARARLRRHGRPAPRGRRRRARDPFRGRRARVVLNAPPLAPVAPRAGHAVCG